MMVNTTIMRLLGETEPQYQTDCVESYTY